MPVIGGLILASLVGNAAIGAAIGPQGLDKIIIRPYVLIIVADNNFLTAEFATKAACEEALDFMTKVSPVTVFYAGCTRR